MKTVTPNQPLVKKSKKDFILTFLTVNTETDKVKAFELFKTDKSNPEISQAFFNKCWLEIKGHTTKAEKVAKDVEGIRSTITKMYEEQFQMQKVVSENNIKALLTDDVEKKKEFRILADAALDKVMAFNRTIRGYMESNNQ